MFETDMPENFEEMSDERKEFLLNWISENLRPIKTINLNHTSYGIKHWIDGEYFTNGEFKGAMLKAGYKVKDLNATNWHFNISERSPIILKRKS